MSFALETSIAPEARFQARKLVAYVAPVEVRALSSIRVERAGNVLRASVQRKSNLRRDVIAGALFFVAVFVVAAAAMAVHLI